MKTNFTFDELSKIFALVAKMDVLVKEQVYAVSAYDKMDAEFDKLFEKYGYTFYGASQELHTVFEEKCKLMDDRDKTARRTFKAVKDFAALVEIGGGLRDFLEDEIKDYIAAKRYWNAEKVVRHCRSLAVIIANRVR
jgi:hypothetical protein